MAPITIDCMSVNIFVFDFDSDPDSDSDLGYHNDPYAIILSLSYTRPDPGAHLTQGVVVSV
jgi:hypothetical protein